MQRIPIPFRDDISSINLPPIPHVLLQFLRVVEDDNTSIGELALLVGHDPSLCARFMTVANSPALRREQEVTSLEQCIITLGTRLARTLAACIAIQVVFARTAGEAQYDFGGFWRHCLTVAELSRAIAVQANYPDTEEAYLAGLMHDIGLLLLLGSEGERYGDVLRRCVDESVLMDIEKPLIGTDHTAVGAWLIDHWKLSSFISDAILFHHKSSEEISSADYLSQIVWSAHIASSYHEKLDLTRIEHDPDLAAVKAMLNITSTDLTAIRGRTARGIAVLASALGLAEADNQSMLPVSVAPVGNCKAHRVDSVHGDIQDLVRDMSLATALQQNMSSFCSEEEMFLCLRESARILFGLGRLAFLVVAPDTSILSGPRFAGQSAMLQRLAIRLDPPDSLAGATTLGSKPWATFDKDRPAEISLVDVQIAHILDSEGLLYVPMRVSSRHIGLMVFGISVAQHSRVQGRLSWMMRFANLAGNSIAAWQEMRSNEKELESKLASKFELHALRVVHEAGNPLSIIKNYLKIVAGKIPDDIGVNEELDILREEIDRVSHILQRLSSQSGTPQVTGSVDINRVIETMLTLYSDPLFWSRGIAVEKSLDPAQPLIAGDRDSVKQILLNIWKNAAEAIASGARVSVSTRDNVMKSGRPFIELMLSDSGPGLPPDVLERLFQPLNPNRRPGHSGVGLSIVASLVERINGQITCHSEVGHGTVFSILLPRANGDEQ